MCQLHHKPKKVNPAELWHTWQGCPMDDNGNAFLVFGHLAFCRNINAQVASNCPAHRVVLYFSNVLCGMALSALCLVSCKLKIYVCMFVHVDTPKFPWVLMEMGTTLFQLCYLKMTNVICCKCSCSSHSRLCMSHSHKGMRAPFLVNNLPTATRTANTDTWYSLTFN